MMVNLYQQTAKVKAVIQGNILTSILEVYSLYFCLEKFEFMLFSVLCFSFILGAASTPFS